MSVITLDQIENELRLVQARFILAENGVETFALSPSEVIPTFQVSVAKNG